MYSVSVLVHYWPRQHPYPSLFIKVHTVSGCVLLRSISNHITGHDHMALSYSLNVLTQACGFCHMVFSYFRRVTRHQDVSCLGEMLVQFINMETIYVRCCGSTEGSHTFTVKCAVYFNTKKRGSISFCLAWKSQSHWTANKPPQKLITHTQDDPQTAWSLTKLLSCPGTQWTPFILFKWHRCIRERPLPIIFRRAVVELKQKKPIYSDCF